MGPIEYCAITRRGTVLVSHQESNCDFEYLLKDILRELPTGVDTRTTRSNGGFTFHFMIAEGLTYLCATVSDAGLRLPFTFLDLMKERFNVGSLPSRAWTASEHELDRDFASVAAEVMERCNQGKTGDQISSLQGQVAEVKGIMTQNIERIVERGDRLDSLLDKTQELESSSTEFRSSARKVRTAMCVKNARLWIVIGLVLTVIVVLVALFATGVIKT